VIPSSPRAQRRWVLLTAAALAACVAATTLAAGRWPVSLGWAAVALLPVLLPLPGLLRGDRRTHAWATLCVAPYFIYGVTEVVANPAVRMPAAAILFASLAWFIALVHYLRLSRPGRRPAGQDAPLP
jgi:uncharacterized membrane protein